MNFGSIVKYYRLRNGLTQAQLSDGICSISHLSKIESNKYIPHRETIEELFRRMNIEWKKEIDTYKKYEEKLSRFIEHSVYYDFDSMEKLYEELKADEDYLQSTDLVNRYELYKLRYYLYKRDVGKTKQQMHILDKLRPTFNDYERAVAKVISVMYFISIADDEKAGSLFLKINEERTRIPKLLEGEYFYQNAWFLHKQTKYGKSSYYAEMAVHHFQEDCNYKRLMHAQLLLAINYTNRDFYLQAEKLFQTLMRNTKMMEQVELYQQVLYNFSVLQNRLGNHKYAYELLMELKEITSMENDFYYSVLVHILYTSIELKHDDQDILDELKIKAEVSKNPYLKIVSTYFEQMKFSQQELYDYCEQKLFPFFEKYGYIGEGRRVAYQLTKYYRGKGDYQKADTYSSYYYLEGVGE